MFIIDFDHTLCDTHRWKQMRHQALEHLGISREDIEKTYVLARDAHGKRIYSDQVHADFLGSLGYDREKIVSLLRKTTRNMHIYLFPDARDFLTSLKNRGERIVIMSLGSPAFQEEKIRACNLDSLIDEMILVDDTKKFAVQTVLKNIPSEEIVWWINDRIDETEVVVACNPRLKTVLRSHSAISIAEYEKSGFPFFPTLTNILEYVESQ